MKRTFSYQAARSPLGFVLLLFLSLACTQAQQPEDDTSEALAKRVIVGAERLDQYLLYVQNKTTAVVANQASMVGDKHLVDTLLSLGGNVKYILCPEHGFRGDAEAGEHVKDGIDPSTGLPIISLYGSNKKPKAEQLKGIDQVVFDLQDVGCRFYTYISTLHYVMEYCAENQVPLIVLDRPNPNAGYVDGPVMEKEYCSFVGMHPGVPVVYGMTIGEYAQMINGEKWLAHGAECQLFVVTLQNYTHQTPYSLPIPPSPNLRTDHAIALYPSLCLFEGTNVSVGRGTRYPFEWVGSTSYNDPDNYFSFQVKTGKATAGHTVYHGLDLRDVEVKPCFDLTYLIKMYQHSNKSTFFLKNNFFEKLAGTAELRKQIVQGVSQEDIRATWQPGLERFRSIREKYLLYD